MSTPMVDRVVQILAAHVFPLMSRTRRRVLRSIAERLVELDPEAGRAADPPHLIALALHTMTAVRRQEDELARLEHRFAELQDLVARRPAEERRDLLADWLRETVSDPIRRRGDLRALDRWLDEDALRERHVYARNRALGAIEIGLTFIGRAAGAALAEATAERAALTHELFDVGRVDEFLRQRLEKGARWQVRYLAADAYTSLLAAAGADAPLARLEPGSLGPAVRRATDAAEHFPVQVRALELVLALSRPTGDRLLAARLLERPEPAPRHEFLVRRQLLDLLARRPSPRFAGILERLLAAADPSEHVRMGLPAAIAACDWPGRAAALRRLAGAGEPSPRVRAQTAIAAVAARTDDAAPLLAAMLSSEEARLPLLVACEEAVTLAGALDGSARIAALAELLPPLLALSARPGAPAEVHEAAAAAAEGLERLADPTREAWSRHLAELAGAVAPGDATTLSLVALPAGLPPLPDDPLFLGRILADLSRRDWGLAATLGAGELRLFRGDRFGRRLWRVLRELRHPDSGKRQAHRHTVGRRPRGELRAPPGRLDEIVATGVPGERVTVEGEAGWGRHLPSVDDCLDLPLLGGGEVRIFSSHGVATLTPPATLPRRLRTRLALSLGYPAVAATRLAALTGREEHERRAFADRLRALGIGLRFERYRYAGQSPPPPGHVAALFPDDAPTLPHQLAAAAPLGALHQLRDWLDVHAYYFLSPNENSQAALALFAAGFAAWFLGESHLKRRRLAQARARIPLSIGGWGTRGKSGTERLKAALLHGLGYEVLVKTTGCEAMVIHCLPDEPAHELFLFRSYDKASIWEVKDTVELAADLGAEVYLWECMALNPKYVELLQRDWIRDDVVTLTNCFPDHEDIQGPAGIDVAECIAHFVPDGAACVTSEVNFLPVLRDAADEAGTRLVASSARDAELIADDVLALFPYQEHPRNIALVARLAEEFHIERDFAIATMAEHVVPDLGVLKAYPPARVRGRVLTFINGMSANERTGFLSNWERTGLATLDAADPTRTLVTVVNNRYDRVARSAVFAQILVHDTSADAHLLIGTNLRGLEAYLGEELGRFVDGIAILRPEDVAAGDAEAPRRRLARLFARLRIPVPDADQVVRRVETYAAGAHLSLPATTRLELGRLAERLAHPEENAATALDEVEAELSRSEALGRIVAALVPARVGDEGLPETASPIGRDELGPHVVHQLARLAIHARLRTRLGALCAAQAPDAAALAGFHDEVRAAYRALFEASVHVVDDAGETGDRIIDRCARAVPPGTRASVIGIQNIKGTGLDFVYRWLAHAAVTSALAQVASSDADERRRGLAALDKHHDWGLVDAGTARVALAHPALATGDDAALVARLRARIEPIHEERRRHLEARAARGLAERLRRTAERLLDPIDSIRRRRHAERVLADLVARRISHARAAVEMRRLYDRQRGGWFLG